MEITNIHQFLEIFFREQNCDIIENNRGTITVQLTEEMDKTLMNRPFYWQFMQSTHQKGEPMRITLATQYDEKQADEEWIHFGSPRLQQIMNYLKKQQRFIQLFQQLEAQRRTPLYPWLFINIKVSYNGQHKKEEIFSIGLNLVNGIMKTEMMSILKAFTLRQSISDYCYTISPLITLKSGFKRIEQVLDDYVNNQNHDWAQKSRQRLKEQSKIAKHFFQGKEDHESLTKEMKALKERYTPNISYEVINGGLVHLALDDIH